MKQRIFFMAFVLFTSIHVSAQATGDPWIRQAYKEAFYREPNAWEYNINLYNGGHWNSLDELKSYINNYLMSLAQQNITIKTSEKTFANNTVVVGIFQNGTQIAADLVASGGGNLVASGGGNIIASGGGNIVATGGGNLVASGGGNIAVMPTTPGATFGGQRTVLAAGSKMIKLSGTATLIVR